MLGRVRASGLCHTDLEVMRGSLRLPVPILLEHEGAGVVKAVGSGVTAVRSGDHVVRSWSPSCGRCSYCDLDQPIHCEAAVRPIAPDTKQDGADDPDGRQKNRRVEIRVKKT